MRHIGRLAPLAVGLNPGTPSVDPVTVVGTVAENEPNRII